jgi:uncharacterized protein (TIGR02147 family)
MPKLTIVLGPDFNPSECPTGINSYSDYHAFCKDRYATLKNQDKKFSFRSFSKDAGFASPNYLHLIMHGERNLSPDGADKFALGLRLNSSETEYFRFLVMKEYHKV